QVVSTAARRVERPVRMVYALGVAADLLADHPAGVGVAVRAAHAPDGARVDPLDLESAGAGAVVGADRGHDLHGESIAQVPPLLHSPPWPTSDPRPRTSWRWSGWRRRNGGPGPRGSPPPGGTKDS